MILNCMQAETINDLSTLESETAAALGAVRTSLSALMRCLGSPIQRPTDLQRLLEVDTKLSWQVFNVANEPDVLAMSKHVPGAPSLRRLLHAATRRGVTEKVVGAVQSAVDEFNRVVQRHAVDRAEFDLMVSSVASVGAATAAELSLRKTAFRTDSHIWGVATDVIGGTTIVRRRDDGTTTDEISLINKRGCRRLRRDASLNVFAYRNYGSHGSPPHRTRLPLDPASAERYGAHLLPQFCSQPIPIFRTWQRPDGFTAVDVQSREIGRLNAVNLTLGHVFRDCPLAVGLRGQPYFQSSMRVGTPAGLLVSVLLVHRPTFGSVSPGLMVFRQTPGDENPAIALSAPQIATRQEVRYMGVGRTAWETPDIESHADQVQKAFDEIGWNPNEFDVFHLRIEYPVLHTVVRMEFEV